MRGIQIVYILKIWGDNMTAKDLLFYLIRGFSDKTLTNDTTVSVIYKEGMGDFILRASTDIEYDELCLFNFKSGD